MARLASCLQALGALTQPDLVVMLQALAHKPHEVSLMQRLCVWHGCMAHVIFSEVACRRLACCSDLSHHTAASPGKGIIFLS